MDAISGHFYVNRRVDSETLAMAKNRNKKKLKGSTAMETSSDTAADCPQAMEILDAVLSKPSLGVLNRTIKKARLLKRSKNLRKQKAIERAISKGEKMEEKACKMKSKVLRVQSAKSLYE
ncbi:uncharacterized protein LOC110098978 [Dendrobium catenatum]|uniref:uncharacterized protein LOC110098978 n=1 Tax=Dendrobium catenatum TaxID=906689 RepID=UPI0010A0B76E|nr:uncharacterized protein LOC110098978 [Dendrobium catenatum]